MVLFEISKRPCTLATSCKYTIFSHNILCLIPILGYRRNGLPHSIALDMDVVFEVVEGAKLLEKCKAWPKRSCLAFATTFWCSPTTTLTSQSNHNKTKDKKKLKCNFATIQIFFCLYPNCLYENCHVPHSYGHPTTSSIEGETSLQKAIYAHQHCKARGGLSLFN